MLYGNGGLFCGAELWPPLTIWWFHVAASRFLLHMLANLATDKTVFVFAQSSRNTTHICLESFIHVQTDFVITFWNLPFVCVDYLFDERSLRLFSEKVADAYSLLYCRFQRISGLSEAIPYFAFCPTCITMSMYLILVSRYFLKAFNKWFVNESVMLFKKLHPCPVEVRKQQRTNNVSNVDFESIFGGGGRFTDTTLAQCVNAFVVWSEKDELAQKILCTTFGSFIKSRT